ncbi:hypothetical protein NLM33_36975 [Bradyrhizobium sp. CCGUVB1N3]|uniref:hypothetical protein n=1 Tax=Bradyrhizobium sp. CCGUVB1N3 TaxID=2949629 RepID=UPI0020B2391A|nr:hypothetical protein [Bradyrhizobium sp. CCGUVB1N3]MCP3475843.1 hypothetical protein [Bradyrhizobium sp. CCGUVB1N3]
MIHVAVLRADALACNCAGDKAVAVAVFGKKAVAGSIEVNANCVVQCLRYFLLA